MDVLKSYFVLAFRNLIKNKVFSLINLLGLSVGITSFILIFQYTRFELSYDRFHKDYDNIYRIATRVVLQNEVINHEANTYEGVTRELKEVIPEVRATTSISGFDSDGTFVRFENAEHKVVALENFNGYYADSAFFSVFSFPLLGGDQESVLKHPYSAVISESFASAYFDNNAIGKVLEIKDGSLPKQFRITGVIKDIPDNSHFKFDLLINEPADATIGFWFWGGHTYAVLQEGVDPMIIEQKLNQLAKEKNDLKIHKDDYGQVSSFELQKLSEIHLFSNLEEELEINGSGALVYSLLSLAFIILIIAWINYINLSTAISAQKVKEIGIRKVVGASKTGLMKQVLTEAALFNVISLSLAMLLSQLLLPYFSELVGVPIGSIQFSGKWVWLSFFCFLSLSTVLSGIYPAFIISSFYPVSSLRGNSGIGGNLFLRRSLVVFQFSAAIILMVTTLVAYRQLTFMRNKELGINIDKVLVVKAMNFDKETWSDAAGGYVVDSTYRDKAALFKKELTDYSGIENATSLSHLPGQHTNWGTEFKVVEIDPKKAFRLNAIGIDYDFLNTFHLKLLAGRNFSTDFPSDQGNERKRAVMINEEASKLLGFKTPGEAVHRHIAPFWATNYEIIGVVNSFHQLSPKENLEPIYFILQPRALSYYAITIRSEDIAQTIDYVKTSWIRHFPDYPCNYFFLDEYFNKQYEYDQAFGKVTSLFTALAVFIACMGLFGLTSYAIVKRTKEIGIRKVLGATISNVIGLFSRDFVKLILIANTIAIPLVYSGITKWLENYAYKISLDWWLFAVPVVIVLGIALVTLSLQTIQVALRNPAECLKYE